MKEQHDERSPTTIFSATSPPFTLNTSEQAPGARHAHTHNLPLQPTQLLGREQEVAAVCALLRRPEVRLVTLTGPGGVGKTRLGLEVATDLLDVFADRVPFVSLASIRDPDLVIPALAQVLGLKETGEQPLLERLKAFLRDTHMLLVLDNFEQVVVAAPRLSELLTACLHLKFLVTSRAALRVRDEHEFPVLPLALPNLTHLPTSEVLSQYGAVALFIERACSVKPGFEITATNARTIAESCPASACSRVKRSAARRLSCSSSSSSNLSPCHTPSRSCSASTRRR